MTAYADDITEEAEAYPTLGAEYFEARKIVERFLSKFEEEHAKQLFDAVVSPLLETVQEKVWDSFRDHLLSDTEHNIQAEMRSMVERSIEALIAGKRWSHVKYIETKYSDGKEVRETLAKLYSDPIKDGRIADLEAEVKNLEKQIDWYRR